jgi:hypothetical protein
MKQVYILPLVIFALGIGMVVFSASADARIPLFGLHLPVQVVRGVGLIFFIFSAIAFLAAYGSTLPPRRNSTAIAKDESSREKGKHYSRQGLSSV